MGMTLAMFTFLHVLISLVGIAAGLIAMTGLLDDRFHETGIMEPMV